MATIEIVTNKRNYTVELDYSKSVVRKNLDWIFLLVQKTIDEGVIEVAYYWKSKGELIRSSYSE